MVYAVKFNNEIIFKGNYYECVDFTNTWPSIKFVITARK